jgi:hypothetical protein
MKLEDATCQNTNEYSLTCRVLRVKMLYKMTVNPIYSVLAVEINDNTVYKTYVFSECLLDMKINDIFYVKFGRYVNSDVLTRYYNVFICDKDGVCKETTDKRDYNNYFA